MSAVPRVVCHRDGALSVNGHLVGYWESYRARAAAVGTYRVWVATMADGEMTAYHETRRDMVAEVRAWASR